MIIPTGRTRHCSLWRFMDSAAKRKFNFAGRLEEDLCFITARVNIAQWLSRTSLLQPQDLPFLLSHILHINFTEMYWYHFQRKMENETGAWLLRIKAFILLAFTCFRSHYNAWSRLDIKLGLATDPNYGLLCSSKSTDPSGYRMSRANLLGFFRLRVIG